MINWFFFDIGSTLVDETEAYDHRIRDMIADTNITYEEYDAVRISLARQGFDGNSEAIKHFGLTKTPWHSEDEVLYPDVHPTLIFLRAKGYKLGIIANQNLGIANRLESWGVRQYFDVIVSSAEVGYAKPDIKIFEIAFETAGCTADNSIMVGDRLDNDIIPAKAIGMKTVWIKNGLSKLQDAKLGEGYADHQIYSLREITKIF